MNKITSEEIKEAVDWLMKEKEGCWSKRIGYSHPGVFHNNPLCFVIGWDSGFDTDSTDKYADGEYRICCKIAFNDSDLQCDYNWDFVMPEDEDTEEVDDTNIYVGENFDSTAKYLNEEAERIIKEWNLE